MLTSCSEVKHKLFTSYWFTTLDLLHHFRSKGIHAVGTTRLNHLQDCPIDTNKDLMKNGRGTIYYRCDGNSDIMTVKWVDNSVVNISSDFAGVEPVGELERWHGKEKVRKTFHALKLFNNAAKTWEVLTWETCCYRCIEYHARESSGTKRCSGILLTNAWIKD